MEEPKIVYEDKNFLGIYKPAGMLVHPISANSKWPIANGKLQKANRKKQNEPCATLTDWLVERFPEIKTVGDEPGMRPGIVHRLDKDTSGIMIVPRNKEYFEYFKNLFKTRQIEKKYLAVVFGEPKEKGGVIDKPIGIKSGSVKRSVHSEKMLKNAVTEYKVKKTFTFEGTKFSLLEVFPKTGRTHQIRVHLAFIGCPVVGDRVYGAKKQPTFGERLMLHAYSIEFPIPSGTRMKLEVEADKSFSYPQV